VWHTYVYWARSALDPGTAHRSLMISKASTRLRRSTSQHLQALVFAAFVLEYRIKRIYEVLGLAVRKRDTLGLLLENFKHRIETATRLDNRGLVRLPREWTSIEKKLRQLSDLRNQIAHANYKKVLTILPSDSRRSRALARSCFNAVVDAIRVTNQAIAYDGRSAGEARRAYAKLKVK
jgi:hypothetical protein